MTDEVETYRWALMGRLDTFRPCTALAIEMPFDASDRLGEAEPARTQGWQLRVGLTVADAGAQPAEDWTVTSDAEERVAARERESGRGSCPRCRRELTLATFELTARTNGDIPEGHVVILETGAVRMCLFFREPGEDA